ncbi:MAG: cyclic peptide export ABC transporter [Pyrinomonadaceae bacterium]
MKLVSFLLKYSRRFVALAILAGVISGASNTALLAIINAALVSNKNSGATLVWSFIALCLMLALTRAASELLLLRLGQGALFDLRMRLSRQILAVPLRNLEEVGAPRLFAVLTDDVPAITNVVNMIPVICINTAVVLACLVYMGFLSWVLLLAILGLMVLGILSYQFGVIKALKYLEQAREEGDSLYKHFGSLTDGIKELKLHRRRGEAFLTQVLQTTAASFRRHNVSGMTIYTLAASWGQLLVFVIIGLLIFVLPGFTQISVSTLTGFTIVMLYMMTPLQVVMNTVPTLGRGEVALRKVEEMGLTLAANIHDGPTEAHDGEKATWRSLELNGVTHSYMREGEDSKFTLGPIDLSLEPGGIVFLVGGNGSGKTTLAKLLTGLYAPETGRIYLDGRPITDENRDFYCQHFSVVFSDFYIFESLLGLESPELDAQAQHYLTQLQLTHKVQVKEGALSTTDLSQGQRKRLALLTAYLEDRPIYLFDEWAADQDPAFKEVFYHQLLPELKSRGKTVIVISHDDRYYYMADRIIKLDYGKIESDSAGSFNSAELQFSGTEVPNTV